jgi:hypothetical protein
MVRVKGSGTFCHWGRSTRGKLASGKRLPTPWSGHIALLWPLNIEGCPGCRPYGYRVGAAAGGPFTADADPRRDVDS